MEVDFTGRVTPIPNTQGEEVSGGSQEDSASPVPPLESSAEEVSGELVTMEGLEAIREAEKHKKEPTKRSLSAMVAKIFDPLCLLLPWKMTGNLILRDVWKYHHEEAEKRGISKTAKLLWDEPLPASFQERIKNWKADHEIASTLCVPRCLRKKTQLQSQEIYGFSDASPEAMGAVVYLKCVYRDGSSTCRFVVARAKVNADGKTLPRCELIAARFLACLQQAVKQHLGLDDAVKTFLFSDSQIALAWLKSEDPSKFKSFVHNRVQEIQKRTKPEQWYYVNTKINPADLMTRGITLPELVNHPEWFEGPSFVLTGPFPDQPEHFRPADDVDMEIKKKPEDVGLTAVVASAAKTPGPEHPVSKLLERHGDILKVLRIIAWMKRAYRKGDKKEQVFSNRQEFNGALDTLALYIQAEAFPEAIKDVSQGKQLGGSCRLASLAPFLDEKGLLRAKGRLSNSPSGLMSHERLFPIIMPSSSPVLEKLILYFHEAMSHAGTDAVHAFLRQRWWVLRGRATVQKYRSRCLSCRKVDGQPVSQRMAPLPDERVAVEEPAFTNIAIDGLGPMWTQEIGRKQPQKTWVLVIICSTTRAINLEILPDLTAESFVTAVRRQIADYGLVRSVRLDNLRSHVRMKTEFDALLRADKFDKVKESFKDKAIKWSFSAVGQPSTNGVVERAVRITKSAILKTLGTRMLSRDQLLTFLKEVKSTVNSRPLAQVHQGSVDDHMAITPNHLVFGHGLQTLPFIKDTCKDQRKKPTIDLWDERQKCTRAFRQLFIEQYVATLRELKKWKKLESPTQVGDLCLMSEPNVKRRDWPLAVVDQLVSNQKDGLVRTVRLRLADRFVTRSIRSLIFLKHLEEYEPSEDAGDPFGPDVMDPPRDGLMKFISEKKNKGENVKVAACVQSVWIRATGEQSMAEEAQEASSSLNAR